MDEADHAPSRVITTPLLLLDLLLTAALPWPTILYTLLIDEVMIITGLIGALVTSSYKVRIASSIFCTWLGHAEPMLNTKSKVNSLTLHNFSGAIGFLACSPFFG